MDDPVNQAEEYKDQTQAEDIGVKVSDWKKKFAASEKVMKRDFLPKYQLACNRVRAEHDVKGRNTKKLTHEQVNMALSIGTSFVNSVYFKSPSVSGQGTEQGDIHKVADTVTACNDWLQQSLAKKVFRRAAGWDAFKGGLGAVFVDYEYDDVPSDQQVGVQPDPSGAIDPQTGQPAMVPQMGRTVLKNEITIQRIRPDLLRFPKGFDLDNYQEAPWLGFDVIMPLEDVKSNEKWDENVRTEIKGEAYDKLSNENKMNKSTGSGDSEDLYAKISYCFKKGANKLEPLMMLVFCAASDSAPLEYVPFDKGHKGYPIHPVYYNPLDDEVSYPNGDVWNIESQLNAIDEWWKQFFNHVKRSKPKFVYDSGSVTPQEVARLKSNEDNGWIGLKNPQKTDLRALFADLQTAELNKDLTSLFTIARQIMSEVAPKSNQSRGDGKEVDTATQAKIIEMQDGLDVEARIDDVAGLVKAVIIDVAGILEKSLAAPITVSNDQPDQEGQPQASRELPPGSFTSKILWTVDRDSLQSNNRDLIRRHLMEAMKVIADWKIFFDLAGIMPDPKFWTEKLMETMAVRNIDKGFIPAPPPPQEPQKEKVSQSMNFNDLPMEGKIQMAAEAGIHLSPEALAQQQILLLQSKQPAQPAGKSQDKRTPERAAPHQGGGNIPSGAAPMGQHDMQMAGQA